MNERLETLAGQVRWAAKNIAYNLDFIPDDKLNWKPAPQALSALEIAGHVIGVFNHFRERVENPQAESNFHGDHPVPASREEAKTKLIEAGEEYCRVLTALTPESLSQIVELPFGKLPLGFIAAMPATDAIHHHGQIAYIQTLLGDTESHFDFSLLPKA
jgi:uncharacterized damage-inducible protein DinB